MENIIKLWKENKIENVHFNFNCGGDSMNDTDIVINSPNKNIDKEVVSELTSYFDDEVYKNVEFYVNSDGHYMGEAGVVVIELDEEDNVFNYTKSSSSEYSETLRSEIGIELTEEEVEFVKKYIRNINGGSDDSTNVNYSTNFIMTDKDEEIEKSIIAKIDSAVENFEPEWTGEPQESYNFENDDNMLVGNKLIINLDNYEYVFVEN